MVATVQELAALVRGRLVGDGTISILAARSVGEAGPGDITFIENERYAKLLRSSPASAAIVGPHFKRAPESPDVPVIEVEDPLTAFFAVRKHPQRSAKTSRFIPLSTSVKTSRSVMAARYIRAWWCAIVADSVRMW